uniref:Uncharacterized protein n=1 Tax=Engystomops pustulosus TaxID=76066 RepID=A0AAV6YNA6_ENGPU|nr:hypothetical protein GDO81_022256 [Engystomops pustulosus]
MERPCCVLPSCSSIKYKRCNPDQTVPAGTWPPSSPPEVTSGFNLFRLWHRTGGRTGEGFIIWAHQVLLLYNA